MKVNGKQQALPAPVSLTQYLKENGYNEKRVAVERNGEIIPKAKFQDTILSDADTLEIVHFVGGG